MALSKNTVSRRIDEMGEDIEKQLVEKLKTRKFSEQMDESTVRDSEAVLKTCLRWCSKNDGEEKWLLKIDEKCESKNDSCALCYS
ncbi:hypothetical protein TNCV_4823051 [Trichonephila clavipes]|nr:hypothetical protein TNCV_4823051 [Trichonephila clavipes]